MTILLAVVEGRMRDEPISVHLTSDRVAAFLDGGLDGAERASAVRHFAECAECRRELAELRGVLDSAHRPRSRGWVAAAAGVAAILAFTLLPRLSSNDNPEAGLTRAVENQRAIGGSSVIGFRSPGDSAIVAASGLELVWETAGQGATYLVTVLDSLGSIAWSRTLTDTSVAVPDSARLTTGSRYFWSVDARLADGRTAKTGVRHFTVR